MATAFKVGFSLDSTVNAPIDARVTGPSTALPSAAVCYPGLLRYHTDNDSFVYYDKDLAWKPWPEQVVTTVPQHIGKVYNATMTATPFIPANSDTLVFQPLRVPAGTYIVKLQLSTTAPPAGESSLSCLVVAKILRTPVSAVSIADTVIGQTYQEGITPQTETTLVYTADGESDYSVMVYVALPAGVTHKEFSMDGAYSNFKMTRILGENDLHQAVQQATIPPKTYNDAGNVLTVAADASAVWQSPFPAKTAANAGNVLTVAADASVEWAPVLPLEYSSGKVLRSTGGGGYEWTNPLLPANQLGLTRFLVQGYSDDPVAHAQTATALGVPRLDTQIQFHPAGTNTSIWSGYFRNRDNAGNRLFDKVWFKVFYYGASVRVDFGGNILFANASTSFNYAATYAIDTTGGLNAAGGQTHSCGGEWIPISIYFSAPAGHADDFAFFWQGMYHEPLIGPNIIVTDNVVTHTLTWLFDPAELIIGTPGNVQGSSWRKGLTFANEHTIGGGFTFATLSYDGAFWCNGHMP